MAIILGIESTCDETGCAIVRDGKEILSNIVASQTDLHEIFGGVVPELACRRHIEVMLPIINEALSVAGISIKQVDAIAVAKGPGLIGALLIGLNTAKSLALCLNKPLIGVNHIEAHLYASVMSHDHALPLPSLGFILSGGHTCMVIVKELGRYQLIGQTTDDAIGEAFDKVAALLQLPYPGGPKIEELAKEGDSKRFSFKAGVVKGKPLDFSFSGLKTSVLYAIKGQSASKHSPLIISEDEKKHVAASFQRCALMDIVQKAKLGIQQSNPASLLFGGGVCNNRLLRTFFEEFSLPQFWPSAGLSLDNAAMIAGLGHFYYSGSHFDDFNLDVQTRVPFDL